MVAQCLQFARASLKVAVLGNFEKHYLLIEKTYPNLEVFFEERMLSPLKYVLFPSKIVSPEADRPQATLLRMY